MSIAIDPAAVTIASDPTLPVVPTERLLTPDDLLALPDDAISPDLVVEVISNNDLIVDVDEKREEYHRAGVRPIWIVYPEMKTIHIYRSNGSISLLHEGDESSGVDIVPGFCFPSDWCFAIRLKHHPKMRSLGFGAF